MSHIRTALVSFTETSGREIRLCPSRARTMAPMTARTSMCHTVAPACADAMMCCRMLWRAAENI